MELEQTALRELIALLEAVIKNSLDAKTAVQRWSSLENLAISENPNLKTLLWNLGHQLFHYMDDEDIRQREPEYGERQLQRLELRLNELKSLSSPKTDDGITGSGSGGSSSASGPRRD